MSNRITGHSPDTNSWPYKDTIAVSFAASRIEVSQRSAHQLALESRPSAAFQLKRFARHTPRLCLAKLDVLLRCSWRSIHPGCQILKAYRGFSNQKLRLRILSGRKVQRSPRGTRRAQYPRQRRHTMDEEYHLRAQRNLVDLSSAKQNRTYVSQTKRAGTVR